MQNAEPIISKPNPVINKNDMLYQVWFIPEVLEWFVISNSINKLITLIDLRGGGNMTISIDTGKAFNEIQIWFIIDTNNGRVFP